MPSAAPSPFPIRELLPHVPMGFQRRPLTDDQYAAPYLPPPRRRHPSQAPKAPPAPPGRPTLAVRVLPRGGRDASLALVEYSLPRPDRRLPEKAADFVKFLAGGGVRVLRAEGVDVRDPLAGSHLGFAVLAEAAGRTPADLEALVTEQVRDLVGGDPETV